MIRPTAVLAALALVALSVPALAVEKEVLQAQSDRIPGSITFAGSSPKAELLSGNAVSEDALRCIENPKFYPANDGNGPRATENYSDSTPYAATAAVLATEVCH
ncbi:hypothetical protein [Gloeobacter morelensis]|uniref:Uncharacterized protein n=1 Tax=Gloeobacter morelensis MG652769 TaxID=2781736 RepID=A0ABY3PJU7_9CYAN|nr:hypothetical protein [Gloeobacter morelensis]UFP93945.1 hypothetical protein ISF26_19575 [Gloeobacter morelensis MG652769]